MIIASGWKEMEMIWGTQYCHVSITNIISVFQFWNIKVKCILQHFNLPLKQKIGFHHFPEFAVHILYEDAFTTAGDFSGTFRRGVAPSHSLAVNLPEIFLLCSHTGSLWNSTCGPGGKGSGNCPEQHCRTFAFAHIQAPPAHVWKQLLLHQIIKHRA